MIPSCVGLVVCLRQVSAHSFAQEKVEPGGQHGTICPGRDSDYIGFHPPCEALISCTFSSIVLPVTTSTEQLTWFHYQKNSQVYARNSINTDKEEMTSGTT